MTARGTCPARPGDTIELAAPGACLTFAVERAYAAGDEAGFPLIEITGIVVTAERVTAVAAGEPVKAGDRVTLTAITAAGRPAVGEIVTVATVAVRPGRWRSLSWRRSDVVAAAIEWRPARADRPAELAARRAAYAAACPRAEQRRIHRKLENHPPEI